MIKLVNELEEMIKTEKVNLDLTLLNEKIKKIERKRKWLKN